MIITDEGVTNSVKIYGRTDNGNVAIVQNISYCQSRLNAPHAPISADPKKARPVSAATRALPTRRRSKLPKKNRPPGHRS